MDCTKKNTDSYLDTLVHIEKLQLLFTQSFSAIFFSLFIAILLTTILWPVQDHSILLIWLSILTFTFIARYIMFVRYQQLTPQGENVLPWEKIYFITLMLSAVTWGVGSVIIMPHDSPIHQVTILCFMLGMAGGAISVYSAHRLMTIITIVTILTPITIWFLLRADLLSTGLALATVLFFLSTIRATKILTNSQHKSLLLTHALRNSQEQYSHLIKNIGGTYLIYSQKLNGEITYVSQGAYSLFGLSRQEILGSTWEKLIDWLPGSMEEAHSYVEQMVDNKISSAQLNMSYNHHKDGKRVLHVTIYPVRDNTGCLISIDGIAEDITKQLTTQEQLRLAANVFSSTQDGVIITDVDTRIIDINPSCLKVTGYSRNELIGAHPSIFSSGRHTPEFYKNMWRTIAKTGHWEGEIWNRRKTGEIYNEQLNISVIKDEHGEPQNYVAVFHDISYIKEREAELKQIAFKDVLTRLPNRLLLYDRMQQALLLSDRDKKQIAICYLDLDGFKLINDSYGHFAGDQVLIEVSTRLKHAVRSNDTVARIGGDEFVLLLHDIINLAKLEEFLDRILKTVSEPYNMSFANITLSVSIGVTLQQKSENDVDLLLNNADQAMYEAKKQGKNRYIFYKNK